MIKTIAAVFFALLMTSLSARAAVDDFSGNWTPAHSGTEVKYIRIAPGGGNTILLRVYGNCQPHACLWGEATARPKDPATPPDKVTEVSATVYYAYARRALTLKLEKGKLHFTAEYHFSPRSGTDKTETGTLEPSFWPAPWQNASWEPRDDGSTGWGGGPQGAHLRPAKEVCRSFDADKATLSPNRGGWQATAGGVTLFTTRWPRKKAGDALAEMRHYRINQKCESGGMVYWQRDGAFPRHLPHASRACIKFSSTTAHLTRQGKDWVVADGDTLIFNFRQARENAYALISLIRHNDITHKCVFAWPNPILVWWLRD